MADLFTGRCRPWIEAAVLARLQRLYTTRASPKVAHIVETFGGPLLLVSDGHTAIVTRVVGGGGDRTQWEQPGVVKFLNWRVVVAQAEETTTNEQQRELEVFRNGVQLYLEIEGSSMERLGSLETVSGQPVPTILKSVDVIRHLEHQAQIPVGDLGALVESFNVEALARLAELSAGSLPIGNLSTMMSQEDGGGALSAIVAAATPTKETAVAKERNELAPRRFDTLTLDSESEDDGKQPANQGIGAVLVDDSDEDDDFERSTRKPPPRQQESAGGSIDEEENAINTLSEGSKQSNPIRTLWGDGLRDLMINGAGEPVQFAEPSLSGCDLLYGGDGIRMWLI